MKSSEKPTKKRKPFKAPRSIHGKSRTKIYGVWLNMHRRCSDPSTSSFKDYGARGISVAPEWFKFETFLADMGERDSPAHSIERKDNSKGYSRENCKWGTRTEQAQNRRSSRFIEYKGERLVVSEWARRVGLDRDTLLQRLNLGWDLEKAFHLPTWNQKTITLDGITLTVQGWARKTGINRQTISDRLSKGWSAERILSRP